MTETSLASIALRAGGLLRDFNRAGILSAADVHVAVRLGAVGGEQDEAVLLAAALAVRSTRHGSVMLDLATARATTSPDVDEDDRVLAADRDVPLAWPVDWVARTAASPLVGGPAVGGPAGSGPLRMLGSRLWLARYWDQEEQVARELVDRCAARPDDLHAVVLGAGLDRLFKAGFDDDQRAAAAACALTRVSVLAGGPGTGKTTTVARLLALLREQHPGWRIALAAPTGKAAARLEEVVRAQTAALPADDQTRLGDLPATTLHRLLGWRPNARSRFRHDATNRLPLEVVVVDEASMVSLTMMTRLLEALRPTTRLVLVGDPDQLASIEAGAVLGDLVDRATLGLRTPGLAAILRPLVAAAVVREQPPTPDALVRDGVSALATNRRVGADSGIGRLAVAVQEGNGPEALAVLRAGGPHLELIEVDDDARPSAAQLAAVRADVESCGAELHDAAARGDAVTALAALERHRLLCAHHRGPRGVQHWSALAAGWIAAEHPISPRADGRYAGEPLLVTTNDYDIGLYNGDTGVVVDVGEGGSGLGGSVGASVGDRGGSVRGVRGTRGEGGEGGVALVAAFGRGGPPFLVPLVRLGAVRSLHAMTVHRSQGSQFDRITVVLPPAASPLGTRQTLYTAVTRAREHVRVIGSASALLAAVDRPAARASGLRERLQQAGA